MAKDFENTVEKIIGKGTYHIGSDKYAFDLISMPSKCRAYVVLRGQESRLIAITKRKDGYWQEKGSKVGYYEFGESYTELDPSF